MIGQNVYVTGRGFDVRPLGLGVGADVGSAIIIIIITRLLLLLLCYFLLAYDHSFFFAQIII